MAQKAEGEEVEEEVKFGATVTKFEVGRARKEGEQSGRKVIKTVEAQEGEKKLGRSLESRSLLQHPRSVLRSGLLIFHHSDGFCHSRSSQWVSG